MTGDGDLEGIGLVSRPGRERGRKFERSGSFDIENTQ